MPVRVEGDSCLLPPPLPKVFYGETAVLQGGQMYGPGFFFSSPIILFCLNAYLCLARNPSFLSEQACGPKEC